MRARKRKKRAEEIGSVLMGSLPTITAIRQKFTGEIEAQLTMLACSALPERRSCWTLQLLADQLVELKLVDNISDVVLMKRLKK